MTWPKVEVGHSVLIKKEERVKAFQVIRVSEDAVVIEENDWNTYSLHQYVDLSELIPTACQGTWRML